MMAAVLPLHVLLLALPLVVWADYGQIPSCAKSDVFPVCTREALISAEVCDRLIAAAEEDGGYDFGYDSLDGKPAVQIDIVENEQVQFPKLHEILKPHLVALQNYTSQHFDIAFVYWVFLRKYSATGNHGRKSVRNHSDSSGATAVTMLNRGFTGGQYAINVGSKSYRPHMDRGTALIHDGVITHGVEPVTAGTRYSLVTFFAVGHVEATFVNDREEEIVVFWKPNSGAEQLAVRIAGGDRASVGSYARHTFNVRGKKAQTVNFSCEATFKNSFHRAVFIQQVGGSAGKSGALGDFKIRLDPGDSSTEMVRTGQSYMALDYQGRGTRPPLQVQRWSVGDCAVARKREFVVHDVAEHSAEL